MPRTLRPFAGYAIAVVSVGLTLAVMLALGTEFEPSIFSPFLAAVTVSALYGGVGPALLATGLSALVGYHFFLAPLFAFAFDTASLTRLAVFRLGLFLVSAVLVIAVAAARNRVEALLRRSQEQLSDFVENAAVGMHWLGEDGRIMWANQTELDLLGYARADYLDHHISEFHVDRTVSAEILAHVRRRAPLDNREAELRCADGSIKHVLISANVLMEGGRLVHMRCFTRDVTERKRAEEEKAELLRREQAARAEAESANRAKDDFLAILGHELRSPLAAIRLALETMRTRDGAAAARARDVVDRQATHITRLLDDLLDVARITRGKISLRKTSVELAAVLNRAVETARPVVGERRHLLTVTLPTESVVLTADSTRLEQVFTNLLNNAAKYTAPGGRIALTADVEDGHAVVRVCDTGVGIAPEFLPRIFEPFAQSARTLERQQEGLGIGLTLAQHLVALHGGTIEARSDGVGLGSEFVVRLPVRLAGVARRPPAPEPREPAAVRRKILVIDDHVDHARQLAELLELWGHDVEVAHSGEAALERARTTQPAVVLLDIGLPDIDGFELARRLRAQAPAGAVPKLVALTGYGQEEHRQRSHEVGIDHYVVKPADPAQLQRLLASLERARADSDPDAVNQS